MAYLTMPRNFISGHDCHTLKSKQNKGKKNNNKTKKNPETYITEISVAS
jgi:hypothetical protein